MAPLDRLAVTTGRLGPGSAMAARAAQPGSLEGCYDTACVPLNPLISAEMDPIRAAGGGRAEQGRPVAAVLGGGDEGGVAGHHDLAAVDEWGGSY